jgi:hypothetical protein
VGIKNKLRTDIKYFLGTGNLGTGTGKNPVV